jgi:1-acyl-sn-glycerol-3-phosphate acyltransferase
MNCIRVAKEGGTICIAPEGNRTYSGKTEYINPAIVSLARKIRLPIALYRIEGGYGVQPRWSDVTRKGKMRSYVSEVIKPEEYSEMTDEELLERINKGLFVDEAKADGIYVTFVSGGTKIIVR